MCKLKKVLTQDQSSALTDFCKFLSLYHHVNWFSEMKYFIDNYDIIVESKNVMLESDIQLTENNI